MMPSLVSVDCTEQSKSNRKAIDLDSQLLDACLAAPYCTLDEYPRVVGSLLGFVYPAAWIERTYSDPRTQHAISAGDRLSWPRS